MPRRRPEIMNRPVVTARRETSVCDLAELTLRLGISGLPVVDADGHLLGIVSETGVIQKEAERM